MSRKTCPTCGYDYSNNEDRFVHVNSLLATKDGRKVGNALVVGKEYSVDLNENVYHVITDYGTRFRLVEKEIEELFFVYGLCCDDHKHRNLFYPANGRNFGEPDEYLDCFLDGFDHD